MEIRAPINAAIINAAELILIDFPRKTIITNETANLDPEDIPKTKGPAIGLWKKVCKRYPDNANAPPSQKAETALGKRMSIIILL